MSFNIIDFEILGDYLVAVSSDNASSGWHYAFIPNDLSVPTWETLTTPDTNGVMRIAGKMALQVTKNSETYWVDAILANSATETNVDNFAIYVDPNTGLIEIKQWTNHYPDTEGGVADSMPYAGRCTMWGDYLVLGDVVWNADDSQPLSESNSSRYSHGLWFSVPGKTDTWDPIDTVFVGQKSGGNVVQGMFPLENGLMVVTCTLVSMLQGAPGDFIYRELRAGISNCGRNGVAYWQNKGGVVWADKSDYVWFTNGEDFIRIDNPIKINDAKSVAAVGEYVFVATSDDVHVYRMYTDNVYSIREDYSAGWTRMNVEFGFVKMIATQSALFGVQDTDPLGSFILDDPVYGLLDDPSSTLWGNLRKIAVFDFDNENRGTFNGIPVRSIIRTRPLPGIGHDVVFWHRFGVRGSGTGKLRRTTSRPSSDEKERGLVETINGRFDNRKDYVMDAHGPSLEATFEAEFDGDVTIEHMTVWSHSGATTR